ncbi:MAG: polysaccharide deacetylase family protein [Firmicutes bacterium]|nr:polysaccharide deacetylase family protein [Bacillota bacterium]
MKWIKAIATIGLLLVILLGAKTVENQGITVLVDGVEAGGQPFGIVDVSDRQLYVTVDFAAEVLGGEVFWNSDHKTAYIKKGRTCLMLPVGEGKPQVNGQELERGEPARDIRGAACVQLKSVSEALGYTFAWREDDREVALSSPPAQSGITRPRYADFHRQGMVSISYDDGCSSHYNLAYPLHLKYNLPASFNIVTGWTDTPGRVTRAQVLELSRAGFEIASHSDTHPNRKGRFFKDLTPEEANTEVLTSKNKLVSWGVPRVEGFVVPGSVYGDWLVPIVSQHYQYTRCLQGRKDATRPVESGRSCLLEYTPNLDRKNLPSFCVVNGQSAEDVIKLIDQAAAEKKWLILMMHKLGNDKTDYYTWDPSQMEKLLRYIASKPRSELLVVPLQDGVRFDMGLGDYRCQNITAFASTSQAAAGDKVLLMARGYDSSGVEVPMASGFNPRWTVVSGDAELVDCQDGTALLTAGGKGLVMVRCSDASDPEKYSDVLLTIKGRFW